MSRIKISWSPTGKYDMVFQHGLVHSHGKRYKFFKINASGTQRNSGTAKEQSFVEEDYARRRYGKNYARDFMKKTKEG